MELWRGTPYAEFADELWLSAEVGGLQEARLRAIELSAEALTAMGAPERVVTCAAEHLAAHPTREALAAPLMLAHYRAPLPGPESGSTGWAAAPPAARLCL